METKSKDRVHEERIPMNITLSPENKKFLKVYALEHGTTVSQIITEYVEKLRNKEEKK